MSDRLQPSSPNNKRSISAVNFKGSDISDGKKPRKIGFGISGFDSSEGISNKANTVLADFFGLSSGPAEKSSVCSNMLPPAPDLKREQNLGSMINGFEDNPFFSMPSSSSTSSSLNASASSHTRVETKAGLPSLPFSSSLNGSEFELPYPPSLNGSEFELPDPPSLNGSEFELPDPQSLNGSEFELPDPSSLNASLLGGSSSIKGSNGLLGNNGAGKPKEWSLFGMIDFIDFSQISVAGASDSSGVNSEGKSFKVLPLFASSESTPPASPVIDFINPSQISVAGASDSSDVNSEGKSLEVLPLSPSSANTLPASPDRSSSNVVGKCKKAGFSCDGFYFKPVCKDYDPTEKIQRDTFIKDSVKNAFSELILMNVIESFLEKHPIMIQVGDSKYKVNVVSTELTDEFLFKQLFIEKDTLDEELKKEMSGKILREMLPQLWSKGLVIALDIKWDNFYVSNGEIYIFDLFFPENLIDSKFDLELQIRYQCEYHTLLPKDEIDELIKNLFENCYNAKHFQDQKKHFRDRARELNEHPGLGYFVANL